MRILYLPLLCLILGACSQGKGNSATNKPDLDIEAELAAIEETRTGFQKAIKEKRYADLGQFATADMISLTPVCGDWAPYAALSKKANGQFIYDSIIMQPKETIIVSDSVAYDFGSSKVYYTDNNGRAVEISDSFLTILKKDKADGVWKLHREVATTNKL